MSEQEDLHREVAVKVLRRDLMSRTMWGRFEQECRILGSLQHRGIAEIYGSGTYRTAGRQIPYYAMELIVGSKTILEYANDQALDTIARLGLMVEVCNAVHESHLKGIMHRDLKPANILVTTAGEPKVIDFGVARVLNSDIAMMTMMATEPGQLIGTLSYMSPEQCGGDELAIDARSDVYSLGVVLFELLCGHLPYDLKGKLVPEAARVICEEEPARMRRLARRLDGDIETIVRTAMEKELGRRYQSASEFAADIARYFRNEPIRAVHPRPWYIVRKFVRRRRVEVAVTLAVVMGMLLGVAWIWNSKEAMRHEVAVRNLRQNFEMINPLRDALRKYENQGTNPRAWQGPFAQIMAELDEQPAMKAVVLHQGGTVLQGAGWYESAVLFFETEWRTAEALYSPENVAALSARMSLVSVLRDNGELDLSLKLALEGVELAKQHLEHYVHRFQYLAAEAQHDRGRQALAEGRWEEGRRILAVVEREYRQTLAKQEDLSPPAETDVLDSQGILGILLVDRGENLDEAISLLKATLAGRTGNENGSEASAAWMRDYLGQAFLEAGRLEEAVVELHQAVTMRISAYHQFHPLVLQSKNHLGRALLANGELSEGLQYLESAMVGSAEILREGHWRRAAFRRDYEAGVLKYGNEVGVVGG